jgi:hypothetical protein
MGNAIAKNRIRRDDLRSVDIVHPILNRNLERITTQRVVYSAVHESRQVSQEVGNNMVREKIWERGWVACAVACGEGGIAGSKDGHAVAGIEGVGEVCLAEEATEGGEARGVGG